MSIEDLKNRYHWISKNALSFLAHSGFQKKGGNKYVKEREDFIFEIYPSIPRPWLNTSDFYEFEIFWDISTTNNEYLHLNNFMEGNKDKKVTILSLNIIPRHLHGCPRTLSKNDPIDFDSQYVTGLKEELEKVILPLFDDLNTLEDLTHLAEQEEKLEKSQQKFFSRTNIYRHLTNFYIVKGWNKKALEMCDKYVEITPVTAQSLAEKVKKKYIQYINKKEGFRRAL